MDKRGVSHIEIIMSFIIFIGFVLFAFYILDPSKDLEILDSSAVYSISEIKERSMTQLQIFSIVFDVSLLTESAIVELDSSINVNEGVQVYNYKGDLLSSRTEDSKIYFDPSQINTKSSKGFAIIKIGKGLKAKNNYVGAGSFNENSYTIASSDTINLISESKLKEFEKKFDEDYLALKEEIGLPKNVDLGFSLIIDNTEKIRKGSDAPSNKQVISKTEILDVLTDSGEIKKGRLVIRVW